MDSILERVVGELVRATPVVIFLIYGIRYFKNRIILLDKIITEKDLHIQELNESWRKSNDDSLRIISKLSSSIDKFSLINSSNKQELLNELEHLKDLLKKNNK